MKTIKFTLPFILFLLFLSCNGKGTPEKPNKIVCVLFDLSETTNTPEIRKTYLNRFKFVLDRMQVGDAIEAALITEKSVSELNLSVEYEFPVINSKTDTEIFKRKAKEQSDSILNVKRDSILTVADSILFKPKRKILFTEIMGSLQVAERVFKSFPQPRKILVVFSDMIEDSKHYNFERENLSSQRINQIINREKKDNLLPNISGVKIYVAGATAKDSERYNNIKNFPLLPS
ncbi:hypothetical protein M1349_03655, partial [Patescibacteria group bacterium]|nr:hypothetical protein [Patescibacteria group bacterium]